MQNCIIHMVHAVIERCPGQAGKEKRPPPRLRDSRSPETTVAELRLRGDRRQPGEGAVRCGGPSRKDTGAQNNVVDVTDGKQCGERQSAPERRQERKIEAFNTAPCHPKHTAK